MMKRKSGWRFTVATLAAVALVSLISFAEFLPHTDDGCAVESHCVACRAHMAALADLTKPVVLAVTVETISRRVSHRDDIAHDGGARLFPEGRAPPSAA